MRSTPVFWIALLAIVLGAGCSRKPDDAALATNIKSQMFSDAQLKGASLQVTSQNGEVTLSGSVPNDAAHLEAYKIATGTPGVTKVNDQINVEETPAPEAQATPAPAPAPAPAKKHGHEPSHKADKAQAKKAKKHVREPEPVETAENAAPPQESAPIEEPAPPDVAQPATTPPPPAPAPQPRQVTIPAGSTVTIRMIDSVDSSVNEAGEIFHASLDAPLVVDNEVAVPKGADVYVRLVSSSNAGRMTGKSELHLELIKLEFHGQSYPLVSGTYSLSGSSRTKGTAEKVGGGAILGTLLGAIAGGGKGAAIGAGVGAAGGGVWQASTRGKEVRVASETKLDFQLDQPVTVTVMPRTAPTE
jgi:BON domain